MAYTSIPDEEIDEVSNQVKEAMTQRKIALLSDKLREEGLKKIVVAEGFRPDAELPLIHEMVRGTEISTITTGALVKRYGKDAVNNAHFGCRTVGEECEVGLSNLDRYLRTAGHLAGEKSAEGMRKHIDSCTQQFSSRQR